MVTGIEKFIDKFKDFTDCYTIIGGAACDILMNEANLEFRATKDIDIILLMEDRNLEFAKVFWEYIKEGGYKCGWRNNNQYHFYRFTEPFQGYPIMIELFSRKPEYIIGNKTEIVPIHIDDDVSSLSAILLDEDFYTFMLNGRRVVGDITVLDPEYLIPFKMYAWLDFCRRKSLGEHVNTRDLKKHKNDIFRLLQIVSAGTKVRTYGKVKVVVEQFLEKIQEEEMNLSSLGIGFLKDEAIDLLRQLYIV